MFSGLKAVGRVVIALGGTTRFPAHETKSWLGRPIDSVGRERMRQVKPGLDATALRRCATREAGGDCR